MDEEETFNEQEEERRLWVASRETESEQGIPKRWEIARIVGVGRRGGGVAEDQTERDRANVMKTRERDGGYLCHARQSEIGGNVERAAEAGMEREDKIEGIAIKTRNRYEERSNPVERKGQRTSERSEKDKETYTYIYTKRERKVKVRNEKRERDHGMIERARVGARERRGERRPEGERWDKSETELAARSTT